MWGTLWRTTIDQGQYQYRSVPLLIVYNVEIRDFGNSNFPAKLVGWIGSYQIYQNTEYVLIMNQTSLYMFFLENTFHICLLQVCQPASLLGNLEFRKNSIELLLFMLGFECFIEKTKERNKPPLLKSKSQWADCCICLLEIRRLQNVGTSNPDWNPLGKSKSICAIIVENQTAPF